MLDNRSTHPSTITASSWVRRKFSQAERDGATFSCSLLLAAFAHRREIHRGLDVLFERRQLFAADDDAGDGLA